MREIKFRSWCRPTGRYISENDGVDEFEGYGNPLDQLMEALGDHEYIWEQWTGLKDKNGVEIYENDIIEYNGYRGVGEKIALERDVVKWVENIAGFRPAEKRWCALSVEVIGNMHQNPELLEEK